MALVKSILLGLFLGGLAGVALPAILFVMASEFFRFIAAITP